MLSPVNYVKVINNVHDLKNQIRLYKSKNLTIGLVPTMGALHEGHGELIKKSKLQNSITIVSIFVNPTQFNNSEDFEKYPRTFSQDLEFISQYDVDLVFAPNKAEEMYPDRYRYQIVENDFSKILCGKFRLGHFEGVLTVVMKLLLLSQCDRAYFGEKDYQQMQLIRDMTTAFFVPCDIVSVPTVREQSGLALSSRNQRLSKEGRQKASLIYYAISSISDLSQCRSFLEHHGFKIEYLEEIENRRYIAVWLEGVRLIDNIER